MFCLVDWDPDGIAIMSTYKHGSYRLAHENVTSKDKPVLNLLQLHWLGVQSHQIGRIPVTEGDTDKNTIADAQGLMRLTPRDRTKARQMLGWDLYAENGPEASCRRELQTMLVLNMKAEMQILDELPGGLATWLSTELGARQGLEVNIEGPALPVAHTSSDDELLL
jgi:meiotic recombination protein SPO11